MSSLTRMPSKQSGFALATVLILLVILAGLVVIMLDGQQAKILQSTATIQAAQTKQNSHNTHRACVNHARRVLSSDSTINVTWWQSTGAFVQVNDTRWADANVFLQGSCLIEAVTDATDTQASWTPKLRITSKLVDGQSVVLEQTEWRYPACVAALPQQCASLSNSVSIKNSTIQWRPSYRLGQPVSVAHRVYGF
jgi:hypothetical protein